jgi:predicted transcriptional regulator
MVRQIERDPVISTRVNPQVLLRLEELARDADRTLAAEIRRAVTEHLRAAQQNNDSAITEE